MLSAQIYIIHTTIWRVNWSTRTMNKKKMKERKKEVRWVKITRDRTEDEEEKV